ncbi:MAG: hypothetical protein J2P17_06355 [Mycobacterium sp.]|nr:hypothetical protein [Mycobacterium sp.]
MTLRTSPPSTSAVVASKRASTGHLWWRAITVCVAVSVAAFTITHWVSRVVPATNRARRQLVQSIHQYGPVVGYIAAIAGAVLIVLWILSRVSGGGSSFRSGGGAKDLALPLGQGLGIRPGALRIKAKWSHGHLVTATIVPPRGVALRTNFLEIVERTVQPYAAADINVTFDPQRRAIVVAPAPPAEEPRWWNDTPVVADIHTNLAPLLGELRVSRNGTEFSEEGGFKQATLEYGTTTKDLSDGFKRRVRLTLEQKVPSPTGAWDIVWIPNRHRFVVSYGTPLPEKVFNPGPPPADKLPRHAVPLGIRRGGGLGLWQPARWPHLLIAGVTGGGKSVIMRTLLVMCLCLKWNAFLCDPKRLGYRQGFARGWGMNHSRIATEGHTIEATVLAVHAEMMRRYQLCEWGHAEPNDFEPILLAIDENTEALVVMGEAAKARFEANNPGKTAPKNMRSPAEPRLWSINRLGREVGVYCVLAHQRPDVSYIPGEARDNMPSRYAAGKITPIAANMLFESHGVEQRITKAMVGENGEPRQEPVPGRATVNLGYGPEPLQGYWTPKPNSDETSKEDAQELELLRVRAETAQNEAGYPLLPGMIEIDDQGQYIGHVGGIDLLQQLPPDIDQGDNADDEQYLSTDPGTPADRVPARELRPGWRITIPHHGTVITATVTDIHVNGGEIAVSLLPDGQSDLTEHTFNSDDIVDIETADLQEAGSR